MELVGAQGQGGGSQPVKVDRYLADCLYGIDMQRDPVFATGLRQRVQVLHHAGFVVGQDHGRQPDVLPRQGRELVGEQSPVLVDLEWSGRPASLGQRRDRFGGCRVFSCGGEHQARVPGGQPEQCQVG